MTETSSPSPTGSTDTVRRGVALWFVLLIVSQLPARVWLGEIEIPGYSPSGGIAYLGMFWHAFFGVSQLITVLPAILVLLLVRRRAMLKGVLLSAGVAFSLNSLCTAVLWVGSLARG